LRIRLARGFWTSRPGLALLGLAGFALLVGAGTLTYYNVKFSRMIDERLSGEVFQNTSRVYAAPRRIAVGQTLSASELAAYLQRAGYTESEIAGAPGQFRKTGAAVVIRPSPASYFGGRNAMRVQFGSRQIAQITSLENGTAVGAVELEPEPLTNLFDSSREKRRLVRFEDLPPLVVNAVLSAEDKRFFEHPGFDPIRVLGAAWVDLRRGSKAQGASTITMQVARSFFFTPERTWRRKLSELLMALQLEQRFTKEQIFELYANQVYLGNRGSFAIHGLGEAAQAYFGKDVRELTAGEAAFLAGIIRAPNRYSAAERNLDRAHEARDRVLNQMVENRLLPPEEAEAARKTPLRPISSALETSAAPYFVDMVKDHLENRFPDRDLATEGFRVYTTLDAELQRAAAEAVEAGMKNVDAQLARRYERWRKRGEAAPVAQVALVAMDPRTGEIKALIGGRDYGRSQLNRALARRQPGSVFKPFVYAAAFANAVEGIQPQVTPVTTVVDEPTTFYFEDKEYSPNNYGEEFHGTVTAREALTRSLNVATVKVAEMVGYDRVVGVARQMGLDPRIQPTPAVALGAYEMTPLDVAAGYSVFANNGARAEPFFLSRVVGGDQRVLEQQRPRLRPALDPRAAYLVTSLLKDVVNRGTGAGVRARGFTAPAAGKTGTSHDGWFAGFTSKLLCVVWVGFDDNRELGLSGASSAAPIWAEFMKQAAAMPGWGNVEDFAPPAGIVRMEIDPETLQLATPTCPVTREEYFVTGTEPTEFCVRHGGRMLSQVPPASWLSRLFGAKKSEPADPNAAPGGTGAPPPSAAPPPGTEAAPAVSTPKKTPAPAAKTTQEAAAQQPEEEKKKGLLQRVFGIFGGGKKPKDNPPPAPSKP
jgi:penicillin-binding protein 1B